LDSTRLCSCVRTAAAAIESKLKNYCRVFVSLTGLDWTRLDSAGVYAPVEDRQICALPATIQSKSPTVEQKMYRFATFRSVLDS